MKECLFLVPQILLFILPATNERANQFNLKSTKEKKFGLGKEKKMLLQLCELRHKKNIELSFPTLQTYKADNESPIKRLVWWTKNEIYAGII
ncbi:hypothetical protein Avbf_05530 [Armadillidium vulgare]|nr:hypothetical protein Avbf_05530 [Armadillidium vulgare]